ncbi:MAG: DUF2271 domain-containing protein [Gemmatimonadaceae bacterium]
MLPPSLLAALLAAAPAPLRAAVHAPSPAVSAVSAASPRALRLRPAPTARARAAASFHFDGVLGTSADFTFVTASPVAAARARDVALAEIERLRRVLSSWDDRSELAQLFATGALEHPSTELRTVLAQYTAWHARTEQAYSARVGELTALWRDAAAAGHEPSAQDLDRITQAIAAPAWRDEGTRVVALTTQRVDLNSLGKGFIIDRAMQAVRAQVPEVQGALVNIGGDIQVWGTAPHGSAWTIGVANPTSPADNAAPLAELALSQGAVSSSGGYARGFTIGTRHYSHLLDPRTGRPVDAVTGVTVLAPDNATANALATSLSVMGPARGLALAQSIPGVEAMLVTADGTVHTTPGFAHHVRTTSRAIATSITSRAAAQAFSAKINIDVTPTVANRHQPYVAVWVTDTAGKHVRTVVFWGDKPKYLREMSKWWALARSDQPLIDAVTRATRPAGKYALEWDGLDQKGEAVPAGTYLFWLEVGFEDGAHSAKSVSLSCGKGLVAGAIPGAAAFTGAEVSCDPIKK